MGKHGWRGRSFGRQSQPGSETATCERAGTSQWTRNSESITGTVFTAEDIALLIREAFLRGISTRQVGRIVATFTGEPVSAQTVSKLVTALDQAVEQFHTAELKDEWAYLFLDGVSLRMRRPGGRKRVHMLVAYAVKLDGTRHLLAFQRSSGESQHAVSRIDGGNFQSDKSIAAVGGRHRRASRARTRQ